MLFDIINKLPDQKVE